MLALEAERLSNVSSIEEAKAQTYQARVVYI